MDILKNIFSLLESENGEKHEINIQGTFEDPLFQANQIGRLLGIKNIRELIRDFGEDERQSLKTKTLGGPQELCFLTELGLYKLLSHSRKPLAVTFQKWIINAAKEIRVTGKYNQKKENLVDKKMIEQRYAIKAHEVFLNCFDQKNVVYIIKLQEKEGSQFVIKIGHTQNIKERVLNITCSYNTTGPPLLLDVFEVMDNCKCEKSIRGDEFIKRFMYSDKVKKSNEPSRETYMVSTEVYEEFVKIIVAIKKRYLLRSSTPNLMLEIELEQKRAENKRTHREYKIMQQELLVKQRKIELEIKKIDSSKRDIELELQKYEADERECSNEYD